MYWVGGVLGAVVLGWGIINLISLAIPWHWTLFFHWLVRGGEIKEIPTHLYPEIRELCSRAGPNGQVNGYGSKGEIAHGLGQFQCRRKENSQEWEITDRYGFSEISEAAAGTQIAEILVAVVGTDYFYKIEATIPAQNN